MAHLKSITTFYTFIPFLPIISLIKHLSLKVCVEGTCPEVLLITEQKSRQELTDIKTLLQVFEAEITSALPGFGLLFLVQKEVKSHTNVRCQV